MTNSRNQAAKLLSWSIGNSCEVETRRVHELFEEQTTRTPQMTAVTFGAERWSYSDLNRRANRLAHRLVAEGVGPGVTVGVSVARSPQLIAALFGVLKAGGTYVALQPDLPERRIAYMISNAEVRLTLTDDLSRSSLTGELIDVAAMDDERVPAGNPNVSIDPDELAYVLYTSGSTGQPKGVMVPHRAMSNLIGVMAHKYPVSSDDVVLQKTPYSFDVSVSEIFNTLTAGASLVMTAPGESKDPLRLRDLILQHGVTVLRMTPTELGSLLSVDGISKCGATVRCVLAAGEALTSAVCRKFLKHWPEVELSNLWGPTEACVYASWWPFDAARIDAIPIGKPLPNYELFSLGDAYALQPEGVQGELYAGGPGLARGYRAMPGKTALAYLPNPYSRPGARMYKSGDVVSWAPDAELDFFGRVDSQVQLRGMRIELGELEAALEDHPGIRKAAVRPLTADDGRVEALAAYVVLVDASISAHDLREHLARYVEEAKIPGQFVELDTMPMTPSGKVDRTALPDPIDSLLRAAYEAPTTRTETDIAELWQEMLGINRAGRRDSFYEIGGHSLYAVQLQLALSELYGIEVPLLELVARPVLCELAAWIDQGAAGTRRMISKRDYTDEAPLSSEQRRMWFLQKLNPDSTAYNVPLSLRLRGSLEHEVLHQALTRLVARHEILRTVYEERDAGPVQRILPPSTPAHWTYSDLIDETDPHGVAEARTRADIAVPFDLQSDLPLRTTLLRVAEDTHILLLCLHHIAIDDWTIDVLLAELSELYKAAAGSREAGLPMLGLQYADYAIWQREGLEGTDFDAGLQFWRSQLAGAKATVDWPFDQPAVAPAGTAEVQFAWDDATSAAVQAFARAHHTTVFVVTHAAFAAFLTRVTGQMDLTLGVPVTMRSRPELQELVGLLLNTVPVRSQLTAATAFEECVAEARAAFEASRPHQWIPIDEIARVARRDESTSPLFDAMFTFVPRGSGTRSFAELQTDGFEVLTPHDAKVTLAARMYERRGGIVGTAEYDATRLSHEAVVELMESFGHFVSRCLHSPTLPVLAHELPLPTSDLTTAWSLGKTLKVGHTTFHQMLEAQVRAHPDLPALRFDGGNWSYAELNARSNRIAHRLIEMGVRQGVPVGVSIERSPALVAALIGAMKAGGFYVALEPSLPSGRLEYMRDDAGARVIVCDQAGRDALGDSGSTLLDVDAAMGDCDDSNPDVDLAPDNLAYMLYTSGTTGLPKGVMIPHRALANLSVSYSETIDHWRDFTNPCMALKASYTFDMFVGELFPPLASGATVAVIAAGLERLPDQFASSLRELGVSHLWATPTMLSMLVESGADLSSVEVVHSGGEALTASLAGTVRDSWDVELWNLYGPTEMCVGQTGTRLDSDSTGVAVIGRPTANHAVTVLDAFGEPRGVSTDGEVVIAGLGEGRGYHRMPRRTALSYMPSAIAGGAGGRMYCTGDIGRWEPSGQIAYRGRRDDQLQVRGIRVELTEIEAHLEHAPGVAQAAVCAVDEAAGRADSLVAYVVPAAGERPTPERLRDALLEFVAAAVVPGRFIFLEKMPLMPSGKIDRAALPVPDAEGRDAKIVLPSTATEERIAAVWRRHLRLEQVGVHENFFEIGGHSLLAVRLQHDLDGAVSLLQLIQNPTIAQLAVQIDGATEETPSAIRRNEYVDEAPVSSGQRRMWFLQQLEPEGVAYLVPLTLRLRGAFNAEALRSAVNGLVARHEILRTVYPEREGNPIQKILPHAEPAWVLEEVADEASAHHRVQSELLRPFNLKTELPLRVVCLRIGADDHLLLLLLHHIAIDEWTTELLLSDLDALYAAGVAGEEPTLLELPLQYADYAIWQQDQLHGPRWDAAMGFWRGELASAPREISWPVHPTAHAVGAATEAFAWDAETSAAVRALARAEGVSVFELLLALYTLFLARWTGQRDLLVAVPATLRGRAGLQQVVGFILNTVLVRSKVNVSHSLADALRSTVDGWRATAPHQWVPFDEATRASALDGTNRPGPQYETMFTYVPGGTEKPRMGPLDVELLQEAQLLEAKEPLGLTMSDRGALLVGTFECDLAVFGSRDTLVEINHAFNQFTREVLASPQVALGCTELVPPTTRAQLLSEWAEGPTPGERPHVAVVLEERAAVSPDAVAVVGDDERLTYAELEQRSRAIAEHLLRTGHRAGDVVGLRMPRGAALVCAMWGVVRARCAILTLDPDYPPDRLDYMLADSAASTVLTDADLEALSVIGSLSLPPTEPEDVAYVLYTSGSTGRPKGVAVTHAGLANRTAALVRQLNLNAQTRMLMKTPLGFDVIMSEAFAPIYCGGSIVLTRPGAHRDPNLMIETIQTHGATAVELVPTQIEMLLTSLDFAKCDSLRVIMSGGEALEPRLVLGVHEQLGLTVANSYGPTETTIDCTWGWVDLEAARQGAVSLGRPMAGNRNYVLDRFFSPVPVDQAGELYIAGDHVSRGYIGRAGLTAERFLPDVAGAAGGRMYRSGDLVRWQSDQELHFLGRADGQLKLRGNRVELGEIEAVLVQQPGVRQALVDVRTVSGTQILAGYVVAEENVDLAELRQSLRRGLPEYMVPASITRIAEIPLMPSGKADRSRLPAPEQAPATELVQPRTHTEQRIAAIWRDRLERDEIGVNQSFFELGGHSLLAVRVQYDVSKEFDMQIPLAALMERDTIAQLAAWLDNGTVAAPEPIARHSYGDETVVSSEQRRMWFLQKMDPKNVAYHVPNVLRPRGAFDPEAMLEAVTALTARHEILRTVYLEKEGQPTQKIFPTAEPLWTLEDCVDETAAWRRIRNEVTRPFDLSTEVPLRTLCLRLDPEQHLLVLLFHHIAIDDWATGIVLDELSELYAAAAQSRAAVLPPVELQYADYALWQQERLHGADFDASISYWRQHLAGAPRRLSWPIGQDRESQGLSTSIPMEFSVATSALHRLAREGRTTDFVVFYAVFAAFLARFTGTEDVTVGLPVTQRDRPELQATVGMLLNTVPLRSRPDLGVGFSEWVGVVADSWSQSLPHQWVPLDEIVRSVGGRSQGSVPLFDTMFTLVPDIHEELEENSLEPLNGANDDVQQAKVALEVHITVGSKGYSGSVVVDTERFSASQARALTRAFELFLEQCVTAPQTPMRGFTLQAASSEDALAAQSTGRVEAIPRTPIHAQIATRCAVQPDMVALSFEGGEWTYGELERHVNGIASRLRELGVGPEVRVGVAMERSPLLLATLLGVLRAGGAYVALQPDLPEERLLYMAADSESEMILCDAAGAKAADWPVDVVDATSIPSSTEVVDVDVDPEGLAYILYTSGSTGRPKGVLMRHAAVSNLVGALNSHGLFEANDVVLWKTPYGFDVSVSELYNTLVAGGRLVGTKPGTEKDPAALVQLIQKEQVTVLRMVPTALEMLVNASEFRRCTSLTRVICAGEALSGDVTRRFFEENGGDVFNLLGATETCVDTTYWKCERGDEAAMMGVGSALQNYQAYALDSTLRLSVPGARGELCVGGEGLARGYNGMARRTATSFVPDAYGAPGGRLYRTGDLVCWNADGGLEYLGRADNQLQVRGVRVELGEIEGLLVQVPGVRQAAVAAVNQRSGRADALVAYVVADENMELSASELRRHLLLNLADAVVPSQFVQLAVMPRTASGKLDRNALPDADAALRSTDRVSPRTETERHVAEIWCAALALDEVGVHESFFELGGHSLLAVRMQHSLSEAFGVQVPLGELMNRDTIAKLAEWLDGGTAVAAEAIVRHDYGDEAPVSSDQRRMWFMQRSQPKSVAYQVPLAMRLRGKLDAQAMHAAVAALAARHEILRTVYPERDGTPIQKVLTADTTIVWDFDEVTDEAAAQDRIAAAVAIPFDLQSDLPIRTTLLRLNDEDHVLLLLAHHIATDEWTSSILSAELSELYQSATDSRQSRLPEPELQYADYAIWQQDQLVGEAFETGLEFWRTQLSSAPTAIDWPFSGSKADAGVGEVHFEWDRATSESVEAFARSHNTTIFVVLKAAFVAFLARMTGQMDLTVGVPISTRTRTELRGLVGLLLNTLPIRSQLNPAITFDQCVDETRARMKAAMPHQWIPFDDIARVADGAGDRQLFDTLFTFVPGGNQSFAGLDVEVFELLPSQEAKGKLVVGMSQRDGVLCGSAEYDVGTLPRDTAAHVFACFGHFVSQCVKAPDRPTARHKLPPSPSDHIDEWSVGRPLHVAETTFHAMFQTQVRETPDRPALTFDGGVWSYEELNARSNHIAHRLIEMGVRPGVPVGVSIERSPGLVAALIGAMKSGGFYVALEPSLPPGKLEYMRDDAGTRVIICDMAGRHALVDSGATLLDVDEAMEGADDSNPNIDHLPDHLAYMLYTSGTTGLPKGVMIPHRALANLAVSFSETVCHWPDFDDPCIALKASYTFDMFVAELFPALSSGVTVAVIAPGLERLPEQFAASLLELGVSHVQVTPTMLSMLVESGADLSMVEVVHSGGEALTAGLAATVRDNWDVEIWNLYGPTEMCVGQTGAQLDHDGTGVAVIGRPTPNHVVTVLDMFGEPRGVSADGEIVIAGVGEGRGYHRMPRRTALSYLPSPMPGRAGTRMYCTGDIGRWEPSGQIAYRGRRDNQLQVRGVRVELTEIEAHLEHAPGVAQAAVCAVDESAGRADSLIAYVVPAAGEQPSPSGLREALLEFVSAAVVPGRFIFLDEMPLMPSGKIDRSALPAPEDVDNGRDQDKEMVLPSTPTEEQIAAIWREHLALELVGVHQNFFAIGGHSLLAVKVLHAIGNHFEVTLSLQEFLESPTIAGLDMLLALELAVDDDIDLDDLEQFLDELDE